MIDKLSRTTIRLLYIPIGLMVFVGLLAAMSYFGPGLSRLLDRVDRASPWRDKIQYRFTYTVKDAGGAPAACTAVGYPLKTVVGKHEMTLLMTTTEEFLVECSSDAAARITFKYFSLKQEEPETLVIR